MSSPPFSELWLPVGHFWDLHIEKKVSNDAGSFTGGGWKLVWHTTESPWEAVDSMVSVLRAKDACPHFCIGARKGLDHPVVVQMIPLNMAGRALAHPSGPETNRANAIQVEICGRAAESQNWPQNRYEALANLTGLITHRRAISNTTPQDFSKPHRMGGQEWVDAKGYVGHSMCPGNDHTDPGRFKEGLLADLVDHLPEAGYTL